LLMIDFFVIDPFYDHMIEHRAALAASFSRHLIPPLQKTELHWGQGVFQLGTPYLPIGDVHFCKKCTSPFFLQSHLFSYFFEAFYDEIDVFFCMACAYLCTDSC